MVTLKYNTDRYMKKLLLLALVLANVRAADLLLVVESTLSPTVTPSLNQYCLLYTSDAADE